MKSSKNLVVLGLAFCLALLLCGGAFGQQTTPPAPPAPPATMSPPDIKRPDIKPPEMPRPDIKKPEMRSFGSPAEVSNKVKALEAKVQALEERVKALEEKVK